MENLLQVSDHEVKICFDLKSKSRATVHLRSLLDGVPIAYKIQTSSPHKFLVNPPSGLISPPSTTASFQIILKPQSHLPPTFPRSSSDRFLIRATIASEFECSSVSSSSITKWFSLRPHQPTHDLKLKVAFIGPLLLRHAVAACDFDAAKSLLRRQRAISTEIPPAVGESILRIAISSGNDLMIRLLVEAGFRISVSTAQISPSLHKPKSQPLDVVETQCLNVNELGKALLESARVGDVNKVKWLIQNGAKVSYNDQYGLTALHVAAIMGRLEVVELLLECGCDVGWSDVEGHTPLHLAVEGGILVWVGANVNAVTDRGASPLCTARAFGYDDIVQHLFDVGASPDQVRQGSINLGEAI